MVTEAPLARRIDAVAMRLVDLAVSAGLLVVLAPLMLALAVLVKRDSPGPALYRAVRVGRDGQAFAMLKFRTMVVGADRGAGLTVAGDARVTSVGRRLRARRLDELPQLINVLRGEMGLVGPRPEAPQYVRVYTAEQRAVLSVRPGITGPTQLRFRDEAALLIGSSPDDDYVTRVLPHKLASDLDYVRDRSLWGDLKVLLATARLLLHDPAAGSPGS